MPGHAVLKCQHPPAAKVTARRLAALGWGCSPPGRRRTAARAFQPRRGTGGPFAAVVASRSAS